jgi:hypothetical protein
MAEVSPVIAVYVRTPPRSSDLLLRPIYRFPGHEHIISAPPSVIFFASETTIYSAVLWFSLCRFLRAQELGEYAFGPLPCSGEGRQSRFWGVSWHDYSLRHLLPGGSLVIGTASPLHCIKRDDYIDRHYVFECIRLCCWICFWNESSKVFAVNP